MRIALSVETFLPKIDGIVNIACRTLDFLRENGVETLIVAPEQGVRFYNETPVVGAPCVVNPKYPEGRVGFPSLHVYNAMRRFKPDVVHAIDPALIGAGAIFSAKFLRVPTIASYHLSISRCMRAYGLPFLERPTRWVRIWGFNFVDHALAPSRNALEMLRGQGVRRIGWWRRGVDSDNFNPRFRSEEMRRRFGIEGDDQVVLLYVGRLAPEKQIHQLKPVLESVPHTRLVLIGGGPQEQELRELFNGLPVSFMGYLQGLELATAYASADMFVFPSSHESFGLVLAEAIASGLPVVSSRVGGAEDVIQQNETGYIFDVGDVPAMTGFVQRLVAQPHQRREMGRKARAWAETLTWPSMMRELLDFYEDVYEETRPLGSSSPIRYGRPKSPLWQPKNFEPISMNMLRP